MKAISKSVKIFKVTIKGIVLPESVRLYKIVVLYSLIQLYRVSWYLILFTVGITTSAFNTLLLSIFIFGIYGFQV